MGKGRVEAFTDGVIAIVITIMVLELKVPRTSDLAGLLAVVPTLLIYALSFVNVGIFWNNHHHMLQAAKQVNGAVLWANNFLLFWMSLIPFVIRWIAEDGISAWPVAFYGFDLTMCAIGYSCIERAIVGVNRDNGILATALRHGWKEKASLIEYVSAIPLAFVSPYVSIALYLASAIAWLIPDRRIEARIAQAADRTAE